jgi:hypothetical protein
MTTMTTNGSDVEITSAPTGRAMMERAVCLSVALCHMGTRRRVDERMSVENVEKSAQPDRDTLRVGKLILESAELDAIKEIDGKIRRYVYTRALPVNFFRSGVYLLPIDLLGQVDDELQSFATKRAALVSAFLAVYPALVESARDKLRALYNPAEYPDARDVAAMFSFTWRYVTFETPGKLNSISRAIFQRESEKMARDLQGAAENVRQALRVAMGEVVAEMVEKMTDTASGKRQIFRDSSIARVQDFLATFTARNLTDDVELATLVERAGALVKGITPAELRDDATLRADIREGFATIKANIAPMLTSRPTRAIAFDE